MKIAVIYRITFPQQHFRTQTYKRDKGQRNADAMKIPHPRSPDARRLLLINRREHSTINALIRQSIHVAFALSPKD